MRPNTDVPWYRVPLLWLGLAILITSVVASIHLIVVSQSTSYTNKPPQRSAVFRGVPLARDIESSRGEANDR